MSSRIEKMLAKTQGIRAAKDIPDAEVVRTTGPKTAVGTMAAWQASQARIEELEKQLAGIGVESLIPIASVEPNPWQPRTVFDEDEIRKLAESISEVGLIQPIIVRRKSVPSGDTQPGDGQVSPEGTLFQLIAGERRLRAHKVLGVSEVKAVIVDASDDDMAVMALTENIDREDLSDWEIAKAIRRAETEFPSRKRMAEALGMGRNEFYRYLSFFELPGFVIDDLDASPRLLTRHSAEAIKSVLIKHAAQGVDALRRLWPRVKSGALEHPRVAEIIESSIERGYTPPAQRDIKKLFVGKEQAGSITRDAGSLTVKIKSAALTPEKEEELRRFVEGMFSS